MELTTSQLRDSSPPYGGNMPKKLPFRPSTGRAVSHPVQLEGPVLIVDGRGVYPNNLDQAVAAERQYYGFDKSSSPDKSVEVSGHWDGKTFIIDDMKEK
jgi:hypothetical protein